MLSVATILKDFLEANWELELVPKYSTSDYGLDGGMDNLFDSNIVTPQIAIDDEREVAYIPLLHSLRRVKHSVYLIVYVKPVSYKPEYIAATQTNFKNIINEIDRILGTNRFSVTGVYEARLTGWTFITRKEFEPIYLMALQRIEVYYQEGSV